MFLAVVGVPLLCLAAAVIYQILKKPPEEVSDGVCTDLRRTNSELANFALNRCAEQCLAGCVPLKVTMGCEICVLTCCSQSQGTFRDPATGAVFESTDGSEPERDAKASKPSTAVITPCSMLDWPTHCEPRSVVFVRLSMLFFQALGQVLACAVHIKAKSIFLLHVTAVTVHHTMRQCYTAPSHWTPTQPLQQQGQPGRRRDQPRPGICQSDGECPNRQTFLCRGSWLSGRSHTPLGRWTPPSRASACASPWVPCRGAPPAHTSSKGPMLSHDEFLSAQGCCAVCCVERQSALEDQALTLDYLSSVQGTRMKGNGVLFPSCWNMVRLRNALTSCYQLLSSG